MISRIVWATWDFVSEKNNHRNTTTTMQAQLGNVSLCQILKQMIWIIQFVQDNTRTCMSWKVNGTELENIEIELIQHENLILIKSQGLRHWGNKDILLCGTEIPG